MSVDHHQELKRAIAVLSEHFDSVQIFACWHDRDLQIHMRATEQSGNPWALRGLIREWQIMDDEETKAHSLEIRSLRNHNPEEL